jgi:hypothetical protein
MNALKRIIILCLTLTIVACGDSPTDKWMKVCSQGNSGKTTPAECKCMAETLIKKIDKKDFAALVEQYPDFDKNKNKGGKDILDGGLVNKEVSMAFLQSAKACADLSGKASKEKKSETPVAPAVVAPPAVAPVEPAAPPAGSVGGSQSSSSVVDEELKSINGIWSSAQWKYGYELKNGIGVATSSNSPKFAPGDVILKLTPVMFGQFEGEQMYKDGKFYKVQVSVTADGRLFFEGDKNVKWYMDRVK